MFHIDQMVEEIRRNNQRASCEAEKVLEKVHEKLRAHLNNLSPQDRFGSQHPVQSFMVLDGVDYFRQPSISNAFRKQLDEYLTQNAALKILTTSRYPLAISGAHAERVMHIPPLDMTSAAQLLVSLVNVEAIKLRDGTKETTKEMTARLSEHQVLLETGGIPSVIADLAVQLRDTHVDDLKLCSTKMVEN